MTRTWRITSAWLVAVAFPAVIGLTGYGQTGWQPIVCLVLLAQVVVLALWSGHLPALVAAAVGAFVVNYCFTPPVGTLRISNATDLAALLIFVIMALGVSTFVNREVARERAVLGRNASEELAVGDLVINFDRHAVTKAGEPVTLTPTEWSFLELLARNVGRLVSREEILRTVWGPAYVRETNYLRVYVAQLRRKLEDDPTNPKRILTTPGQGFTLEP